MLTLCSPEPPTAAPAGAGPPAGDAGFAALRLVQLLGKVADVSGCSVAEQRLLRPLMLAAAALSSIGISRSELVSTPQSNRTATAIWGLYD